MGYGIDVGSTAAKVVSLRRGWKGFRMIGVARRRLPRDADAASTLKLLRQAVGARNGSRPGVTGLSGRDVNLQIVHQPAMKPLNYRVMMGYELDQRKGQATDLYMDYCTLREPDAYFPQYLALIGIGKSAYVDGRIDLAVKAGIDVRDAVPNSFALYECYRNAYDPEGGTILLLDIGSDNMDMALVRGGRLIFARNVSSGARTFDTQVAGAAGVSPGEAEGLKVARGDLKPSADDPRPEIHGAIRTAAGQLTGFITSSIHHAKVQMNDRELTIDKAYLSGGGARVRGLPEYLTGALKLPVEALDPFLKMDVAAVERAVGGELRALPSDLAVAVGLAQMASPSGGTTLSILPDRLRKRRNFLRSTFWLLVAGAAGAATLAALTVLAWARKAGEESAYGDFKARTREISRRIDEMDLLEREQRDLGAKEDYLLSHLSGGRGALEVVSRLRRVMPAGMSIRGIRLVAPPGRRDDEVMKAAFLVRGRGLVTGEVVDETRDQVTLRGHPDPFPIGEIVDQEDGFVRWPAAERAVLVSGEVDENARGGAREVLNLLRDRLTDPSRGSRAVIAAQRASDKPGWRSFEMVITFE